MKAETKSQLVEAVVRALGSIAHTIIDLIVDAYSGPKPVPPQRQLGSEGEADSQLDAYYLRVAEASRDRWAEVNGFTIEPRWRPALRQMDRNRMERY